MYSLLKPACVRLVWKYEAEWTYGSSLVIPTSERPRVSGLKLVQALQRIIRVPDLAVVRAFNWGFVQKVDVEGHEVNVKPSE